MSDAIRFKPSLWCGLLAVALSACEASSADAESIFVSPEEPVSVCNLNVSDQMSGFAQMDVMAYIEAPDADPVRATVPIENWLAGQLARERINPPLLKTYCQIGLTDMVTDYQHAVEGDDAILGMNYRAIYTWNSDAEFPGWQLSRLGQRPGCARGRDDATNLCL